jgi:hypothetical protein
MNRQMLLTTLEILLTRKHRTQPDVDSLRKTPGSGEFQRSKKPSRSGWAFPLPSSPRLRVHCLKRVVAMRHRQDRRRQIA